MPAVPVVEIFKSLQGEGTRAGLPCCFVRTAGCDLECTYCDTRYAAEAEGTDTALRDIVERIGRMGPRLACITGGEPLMHAEMPRLCSELLERGFETIVETNGTRDIGMLPDSVVRVLDVKCPGSGEKGALREENLQALDGRDEVKFVLTDRADFEWAREVVERRGLTDRCAVLFSPAHGHLDADRLADWLLEWSAPVRLQIQLHRLLWPERERGT